MQAWCSNTPRVRCCSNTPRVRCCANTPRVRCCANTPRVRCRWARGPTTQAWCGRCRAGRGRMRACGSMRFAPLFPWSSRLAPPPPALFSPRPFPLPPHPRALPHTGGGRAGLSSPPCTPPGDMFAERLTPTWSRARHFSSAFDLSISVSVKMCVFGPPSRSSCVIHLSFVCSFVVCLPRAGRGALCCASGARVSLPLCDTPRVRACIAASV